MLAMVELALMAVSGGWLLFIANVREKELQARRARARVTVAGEGPLPVAWTPDRD